MTKLMIPGLIRLGLFGCKEATLPVAGPLPTANFVITTDQSADTTNGLITIATYDRHQLTSKTTNATSYLWSFGNDTLRKEQNPVLSYPQSGTYTLTLTVQNETGLKASVSKKVRVLDRVIRQVVINAFNNVYDTTKHSAHPDVWAVVKLAPNKATYPKPTAKGVTFDAPIIFQTPVISAIDARKLPYTFDVPGTLWPRQNGNVSAVFVLRVPPRYPPIRGNYVHRWRSATKCTHRQV